MQLKNKLVLLMLLLFAGKGFAQTDLTLYNMNWTPQSMYQNPALTPETNINIGLPIISSIYAQGINSGFAWKNLFALEGDSLNLTVDNMLDKLAQRNYLIGNFNTDILSVGFRSGQGYFSLNVTEKVYSRFTYPKGLLDLAWNGNANLPVADFAGMGVDAGGYREIGLGYTRDIFDDGKLKIGGRLKYLNGTWNIHTARSDVNLETDQLFYFLTANSDFQVNASGFNSTLLGQDTSANSEFSPTNYLFGRNHGVGLDLGFSWEVIDSTLRVSASLVDLGFIRWKNDPINIFANEASFTFEGLDVNDFPDIDSIDGTFFDSLGNSLLDSLEGTFTPDSSFDAYTAPTIPRFYIGANYLINDKMDAGILFSGEVYKGQFRPTVTASYNLRVGQVLQISPTWTYMNRSILNPGLGFSVNAGPVQLYAVADNILAPFAPQSVRTAHVHAGINLTMGRKPKDRDEDGIPDKEDQCPDDPGLEEFQGCPDRDGDKIIDVRDSCPDVPGLAKFEGCPDRDGDDIQDSEDDCPDTPGVAAFNGCPDRDGDGIQDKEDACPDEPGPEATQGCPDRDGDGVIDSEDQCPDKPGDAAHQGCPDTDGDGLYDNEDRCPEEFGPTDNFGCPYGDLDGDGIFDKEDRCPDTPGPKENQGCPYGDLDGDGVTDNVDECPNTPGPAENNGCPELTEEEQEILDLAFENLEFESGKSIIRTSSLDELDSLASLLVSKPDWKLRIAGHTDDVGAASSNMRLSKNRSNAVKDYLNSRGVAEERFIVEWYGETKPIVPNTSSANRQKNRRVEMEVVFE
jgi:outer membrane protein OmpA-like peptidoglycan-associated protein